MLSNALCVKSTADRPGQGRIRRRRRRRARSNGRPGLWSIGRANLPGTESLRKPFGGAFELQMRLFAEKRSVWIGCTECISLVDHLCADPHSIPVCVARLCEFAREGPQLVVHYHLHFPFGGVVVVYAEQIGRAS